MGLFERNIEGLKRLQPQTASMVEAYQPPADRTVRVVRAKNGQRSALVRGDNGHWYPITSLVEPEKEAQQRVAAVDLQRTLFLFVLGSGFGYSLYETFKSKERECYVICVEPSLELLWETFHYVDLTPMFNTNRFYILTGNEEQMRAIFTQIIHTTAVFYAIKPTMLTLPQSRISQQTVYNAVVPKLIEAVRLRIHYTAGDIVDTMIGLEQSIFNIDEYIQRPTWRKIGDEYSGVPVFVVSTGPSLDKNIEELRRVKGKGLIFAAESAALPLVRRGIIPDALFIMERIPQCHTLHVKDIEYPQETALFALMLVNPKIFDDWQGGPKVPVFAEADPNTDIIHRLCGSPGRLYAGLSASHMAFSMGRKLKAGSIILVGQDLAFGEEGRSHAEKSQYGDTTGRQNINEEIVYVPDYEGRLIPSQLVWFRYLRWYEDEIAKTPMPVIDATEGGARINGTEIMTLKDAVDRYCVRELPQPFSEYIAATEASAELPMDEKGEILQRFKEWFDETIEIHEKLRNLAEQKLNKIRSNLAALNDDLEGVAVDPIVADTVATEEIFAYINKYIDIRFLHQTHVMGFQSKALEIGTMDTREKLREMLELLEYHVDLIYRIEEEVVLFVLGNCRERIELYKGIFGLK